MKIKIIKQAIIGSIVFAAGFFAVSTATATDAAGQRIWESERERIERRREERRERQRRARDRRDRRDRYDDRYGDRRYEDPYNSGDPYYRGSVRGAVNATVLQGYQQGLIAGQYDARKRKYNESNVYRNTGRYPNSGDPTSWDYLYRQGYLEGYDDGFYGRRRY